MTVVTVTYDMEGTLRAALALLPDTRHVALIGGASVEDQSFNELGRQAIEAFGDRLRLIDLTVYQIEVPQSRTHLTRCRSGSRTSA